MILKLSGLVSYFRENFPVLSRLVPRYFLIWLVYFAFLKSIFYVMGLPIANMILIFFALVLMAAQPVRDLLVFRRLQRYQKNPPYYPSGEGPIDDEPFQKMVGVRGIPPVITSLLILANGLYFLLMALDGGTTNTEALARYGAKIPELILENGEYWRIITANFIHVGVLHLIMNMMVLYLFGTTVEKMYGSREYWLIYFASGLGGIIASTLIMPYPGAGASGAIFGIIGAIVVMGFRYHKNLPMRYRDLYTWILVFYILLDFGFSLFVKVFDTYAHLGGFLVGMAVAYALNLRRDIILQLTRKNPRNHSLLARGMINLLAVVFALITLASFVKAWENLAAPEPFYAKTPLQKYSNLLMGVKMDCPEGFKIDGSLSPLLVQWKNSRGHSISLVAERSVSSDLREEFQSFLLGQSFQEEAELTVTPLEGFSIPQREIPHRTYQIYNPKATLPIQAPCQIVTVMISHSYTYILQMGGYQPHRLYQVYRRILQSLFLAKPASFEKIKEDFLKKLAKRPDNPELLNAYGWFLAREQRDLPSGIKETLKATKIFHKKNSQNNPAFLDTLAELYFQKGDYAKGLYWIKKALDMEPQSPYLKKQLKKMEEVHRFYSQ